MFGVNAVNAETGDGGGHEIFATAMGRWLNVSELEALLTPETTPLSVSNSKPISPPPSGTLILYDRSVTRNYKDDGYEWVKKRNSHKVREDHVKLRVGGRFRVAGCYVHCVTNSTLHRRAYHLLDPETGTALNPPNSSANAQLQRRISSGSIGSDTPSGTSQASLILVHYLDTQVAALHSAKIAAETARSDSSDMRTGSRPGRGRRRSRSPGPRSRGAAKNNRAKPAAAVAAAPGLHQQQQEQQRAEAMQQLILQQQQVAAAVAQMQAGQVDPSSATHEQLQMLQEKLKQEEAALAADVASAAIHANEAAAAASTNTEAMVEAGTSGKFDDDTLGILWGMVMEEGGDDNFGAMIEGGGDLFDGADGLISGNLETLNENPTDEGNAGTEEGGMAAVAASAVSAFEQEIYQAAKMTLNKGKASGQGTEIAAELAAAVEAAVEPQLSNQELPQQSQSLVPPFQGIPPVASSGDSGSLPSVQQQLELLQRQRMDLERQQQIQIQQQQKQQEEEAQKLQQQLRELQENQLKQQREAQRLQQEELQQRQAEEQIRVERQTQQLHQQLQKQLELQNQKNWRAQSSLATPTSPAISQPSVSALKSENNDAMETENESTPSNDPLLDIVDFTPEHAIINAGNARKVGKIMISCSAPLPTLSGANDPVFTWHTLVAFVDVGSGMDSGSPDLQISAVDLSVLKKLNPYTYRCTIPGDAKAPGERRLILVGVRLYSGTDPVCQGVGAGVAIALQAAWRTAHINEGNKGSSSHPVFTHRQVSAGPGANANIQLLSQLTEDCFLFEERSNMSAPQALQSASFLRPKAEDILSVNGKEDSSAVNVGTSLRPSKKRPASFSDSVDMSSPFSPGYNAMNTATAPTPQWISPPIKQSQDETMMEDANRHCKIRFVERSSNFTAPPSPAPERSLSQKNPDSSALNNGSALFLDETELRVMDNDQLDGLLDNLFVRVVENLAEICSSSQHLQEEFNSPDKPGFTLLHYASLYNLQSLIPTLIARGANIDAPTARGRLTPLHLASGAGSEPIVELLVRSGCVVRVYDSSNCSPADHAVRNGFPKIAQWLEDTAAENTNNGGNKNTSLEKKESDSMELDQNGPLVSKAPSNALVVAGDTELDNPKYLAHHAFSNLSLKDKLALNLLLEKRRNASGQMKSKEQNGAPHGSSTGEASSTQNAEADRLAAYLASAISETDTESLNMAMRLMNPEEFEDLENSSGDVDEDLMKWMLRRNYESLKDATLYLQHTKNASSGTERPEGLAGSKRGLHNVKNQAIAGLIIRKNMSRLRSNGAESLTPSR